MSTPGGPIGWQVTSAAEVTDVNDAGAFVTGVKVTFRTDSGRTGSVFLPDAAATPENVRRAVDARAAVLEGIATLTSGGG